MIEGLYSYNTSTLLQMGSIVTSTKGFKFKEARVLEEKLLLSVGWTRTSYKQMVIWND